MKTLRRDSSPYSSVASASVPIDVTLQPALGVHTKLLGSDLHGMTSSQMEEAIKPLREVADSLQGWVVRIGSFLERAYWELSGACRGCSAKAPSCTGSRG